MSSLTLEGQRAGRIGVIAALVAVAAIGVGGERWASAGGGDGAVPLAAQTPSVVVPLEPARILDTRFGTGAPAGKVAADQTVSLQVTGVGGVPVGATGVVLNLTVTEAEGAGYVSAYPGGGTQPNASVLNYTSGEDIANMVTATLSSAGTLAIYNAQSSVHLIADVAGYLIADGAGGSTPGPQGPQGPAGPAGPAGPGATVLVNQPVTGTQAIGTYAGFALSATCAMGNIGLSFDSVAEGLIRVTGSKEQFDASTPELVLAGSGSGTHAMNSPSGGMLFSGVVEAAGVVSSVELGIRFGSPCFVWGTIIPAA